MSKTFCYLPWIFQGTRTNGHLRVCCAANSARNKGTLLKEDRTPFVIGKDSLEESRNSELLKEVRRDILNEKWHEVCQRCKTEEQQGFESRRQLELRHWEELSPQVLLDKTSSDGRISTKDVPVKFYELRLGNHCNLKCRSCNPTESSSWYRDHTKLFERDHFKDTQGRVQISELTSGVLSADDELYSWMDSDRAWDELKTNIHNIELIYAVGGEPLLIKKHFDLLEFIIDQGRAPHIELEYNTNLTLLPNRALDLWKHFKKVSIGISIDAYGPLNDYIRNPSRWKSIEDNIDKLDKVDNEKFTIWFATTVMAYNALHIPKLFKWVIEKDFNIIGTKKGRTLVLSTHLLHRPQYLSIQSLPKEAKKLISASFDQFRLWLDNELPKSLNNFELVQQKGHQIASSIEDFMVAKSFPNTFNQFWAFHQRLDQIRNEDFSKIEPDLQKIFAKKAEELNLDNLPNARLIEP